MIQEFYNIYRKSLNHAIKFLEKGKEEICKNKFNELQVISLLEKTNFYGPWMLFG